VHHALHRRFRTRSVSLRFAAAAASATIPPHGVATFSPSVLEHNPGARIRFSVAFFGEVEPPSNANGFALRRGFVAADEKPKAVDKFGFGADLSSAVDPSSGSEPSSFFVGHNRHTGGNGTLTFQHSGPFEVSATIRYKNGDFGGPATTNAFEATQYQVKIFGAGGPTLQYGKMLFAKPSAGIALNARGEGLSVQSRRQRRPLRRLRDRHAVPGRNTEERAVVARIGALPRRGSGEARGREKESLERYCQGLGDGAGSLRRGVWRDEC
jgi:hypothetical protein